METKLEYNECGGFRISVDGVWSDWAAFASIAHLNLPDGRKFIGCSSYWNGTPVAERVMQINEVPTIELIGA